MGANNLRRLDLGVQVVGAASEGLVVSCWRAAR